MRPGITDPRTRKQKKEDWKYSEKEWEECPEGEGIRLLTKREYCEARDYYYARKAREDAIPTNTYEQWLLLHVISSFQGSVNKPVLNRREETALGFKLARPECYSIVEEAYEKRERLLEALCEKNELLKQGKSLSRKEKKELALLERDYQLCNAREDDWVSSAEIMDIVLESDSEALANKYTPKYLWSMAIVYQIFKARGIKPSPEEEEKLKYEILETEVESLSCSFSGKFESDEILSKDADRLCRANAWRKMHIFPDIAEIYLGISNRTKCYQETDYSNLRFPKYYIVKKEDDIVQRYEMCFGSSAWEFFKKEDLRELLFIADIPENLERTFAKELAEHGIDVKSITYENVMKDEEWKDYVFREHTPTALGGKGSPMLINPPMMMEALIDRTIRLKKECEGIEAECDSSFLQSNEDYLHKKWEYYATKLQVLLLDIRRANEMKRYDSVSDAERQSDFAIMVSKRFWKDQLGKYADGWLHADYQLADEQIEVEINGRKETDWQSSEEAYCKKREIALEMKKINEALAKIGSFSPDFNEDLPFNCPDSVSWKASYRKDVLISSGSVRKNDINYNAGNDEDKKKEYKQFGMCNTVYKEGIVRFDKAYLELQRKAKESFAEGGMEKVKQESFLSSESGEQLKKQMEALLEKGITTDTLRTMISDMEKDSETR